MPLSVRTTILWLESSSNLRVFEIGEYISLPDNIALLFLAGVFGINFFYLCAVCSLIEKPYSGIERYTFL